MKEFASTYGFQHITSSSYYPQSNGLAERKVRTVKSLLRDTSDPYLALLSYRATPLPWCNYSPSELLMGRRVKTDIPQTADYLILRWHFLPDFQQKDKEYKDKQKENYDLQHIQDQLMYYRKTHQSGLELEILKYQAESYLLPLLLDPMLFLL